MKCIGEPFLLETAVSWRHTKWWTSTHIKALLAAQRGASYWTRGSRWEAWFSYELFDAFSIFHKDVQLWEPQFPTQHFDKQKQVCQWQEFIKLLLLLVSECRHLQVKGKKKIVLFPRIGNNLISPKRRCGKQIKDPWAVLPMVSIALMRPRCKTQPAG